MAEANDDLLLGNALSDVFLGLCGGMVALLNFIGDFVRAAVLRSAQCADSASYRGIYVRSGAGDDTTGKGRGIELVLRIQNQRGVHGAFPGRGGRPAMQQVQEMRADGIVIGFGFNATAVVAPVIPVEQHGTE